MSLVDRRVINLELQSKAHKQLINVLVAPSQMANTSPQVEVTAPEQERPGLTPAGLYSLLSIQAQGTPLMPSGVPLIPLSARKIPKDLAGQLTNPATPDPAHDNCVADIIMNLAVITGTVNNSPEDAFEALSSYDRVLNEIQTEGTNIDDYLGLTASTSEENRWLYPPASYLSSVRESGNIDWMTAPDPSGRRLASNPLSLMLFLNRVEAKPYVISGGETGAQSKLITELEAGKPILLSYGPTTPLLGVEGAPPGNHIHLLAQDPSDNKYYIMDGGNKERREVSLDEVKSFFEGDIPMNQAIVINQTPQWN